jgi:hypothetical protein
MMFYAVIFDYTTRISCLLHHPVRGDYDAHNQREEFV